MAEAGRDIPLILSLAAVLMIKLSHLLLLLKTGRNWNVIQKYCYLQHCLMDDDETLPDIPDFISQFPFLRHQLSSEYLRHFKWPSSTTEPSLLAQETSLTMEWPVTISTDISGADTWYYQTGSRMLARILMWNILPSTDWVDVWWYNDDAVDHTSCCREIFAKPTDNELVVNWCNNDNPMHCYQWHNWEWLKYLQHLYSCARVHWTWWWWWASLPILSPVLSSLQAHVTGSQPSDLNLLLLGASSQQ